MITACFVLFIIAHPKYEKKKEKQQQKTTLLCFLLGAL